VVVVFTHVSPKKSEVINMKGRSAPEYVCRMGFVAPQSLADAVAASANEKLMSINSWLRRACLEQLARESVAEVRSQRR